MKRYETKVIQTYDGKFSALESTMNLHGNQGWHVVAIMPCPDDIFWNIILQRVIEEKKYA